MDSSLDEAAGGSSLENTKRKKKIESDENSEEQKDEKIIPKRRRKNTNPSRYVIPTNSNASGSISLVKTKGKNTIQCKNLACQAILRPGDGFCKRCSCCLCKKYDKNKDPSLWLTCNSDPPFEEESCGFSCHLDCAFKNVKSGIKEEEETNEVDGCFHCVWCGKTSSLLECWKKQLVTANETKSVEVLCFRLLLAQKLLKGTDKYKELVEPLDKAVKSLETELDAGPLASLPSTKYRGLVNRLRSAPEVKNLCSSALKLLEDITQSTNMQGSTKMVMEDVQENSLALVDEFKISPEENERMGSSSFLAFIANAKNFPPPTPALDTEGKRVSFKIDEPEASCGFGLEQCVKILRKLETLGHVERNFRQKFLTWYSLRATSYEINVVKAFVDMFEGDSKSLADQLIDTFSDRISTKRSAIGGGSGGGGGGGE